MTRRSLNVLVTLAVLAGCGAEQAAVETRPAAPPAVEAATQYVGSEICADCHAEAYAAWRGSHHDLALQVADETTVLGRFPDHLGDVTFERTGGAYLIRPTPETPGLPVRYTFGVTPLQQYVIPSGDGSLQTFPVAWDSRTKDDGGQRWFALQEHTFEPGDPMHWSSRANRWNSHCADCHSTGVRKRYEPARRSYDTTWAVEDVGCEACHGPGSLHAVDPADHRLAALATQAEEIDACAPCHSRRSQIAEGFVPGRSYLDYYQPSLIGPGLYHVDGQIDDEVYVYGSFLQSRMQRAGVTCSDCHDPHDAALKRIGNDTCTFCHQETPPTGLAALAAGRFDTPDHHFHPPDSDGARCVACHMPSKTYMGVDDRRDHSFRIPRPDLSATLGVPEPCTGCHAERDAAWAASVIAGRFGPSRPAHFAAAFAAAERVDPGADAALAALSADRSQPVMVRASALARLDGYQRGYTIDAVRDARDDAPLLRLAAPAAAMGLSPALRWRLLAPLLEDPLRAVRHQTVTALLPTLDVDPAYRARLAPYLEVWIDEQAFNRDYPEVLTNLAGAHRAMGHPAEAEAALEEALAQQRSWVPALVNLADLYRVTGRDGEAGALLDQARTVAPESAEVAYAYALWLSRQGRLEDSLAHFERAAMLAPDQRGYGYAWAVALNDAGDGDGAVAVLDGLLERWPDDEGLLIAAVTMLRDQSRFEEALSRLDRLIGLRPANADLLRLRETLLRAAAAA